MSDLVTQFETAAQQAQRLTKRPDNATLLRIYALYKQASNGDAAGRRPGMLDLLGRAKYDAWACLKGTAQETAMQHYIDLIAALKG